MGKYIVTMLVSACCKADALTLVVYSNRKSISFDCREVKDENWVSYKGDGDSGILNYWTKLLKSKAVKA